MENAVNNLMTKSSSINSENIKELREELIYLKNNFELLVKQRAAELIIANKELAFQNEEKDKRAAELIIANTELAFQNEEKEKRAAELHSVQLLLKSSLESPKDMIILSIDQNYNYYYF